MFLSNVRLAFLDAVAEGESDPLATREGISPYVILFGGASFEGMPERPGFYGFPDWPGIETSAGMTHAAGRYQFEPATWREQAEKLGFTTFSPGNQDIGAWDLAATVYHAHTRRGLDTDLMADSLDGIATVLHSTWTSLSESTFASRYRAALARRVQPDAPAVVVAPTVPEPAPVPPEDAPSVLDQVVGAVENAATTVVEGVSDAAKSIARELDPANFFQQPQG